MSCSAKCPDGIGIEGRVGGEDLGRQSLEQRFGLRDFVHLTRGRADAQRVAEPIDGDVQLAA